MTVREWLTLITEQAVAAITVIRTFLNYFLERDFADLSGRQERAP